MDNFLGAIPVIRRWNALRSLIEPHCRLPLIASRDVAKQAVDYLTRRNPPRSGHVTSVATNILSMTEIAGLLARITNRTGLKYIPFTEPEYRNWLTQSGFPPSMQDLLIEMQLGINNGVLYADAAANPDVTGRISFLEYAKTLKPFLQTVQA